MSFLFLIPIITVVANSFKDKFSISQTPFVLPNSSTFVGVENYISGVNDTGFISAFFWSLFITVGSVAVIVLLSPVSLVVFSLRGDLAWGTAWPYLIGGALGGAISGIVFKKASVTVLRLLFGLLLLYGGIKAVLLL